MGETKKFADMTMSDLKNETLKLGFRLSRGNKAEMQKQFASLYGRVYPNTPLEEANFEVEVMYSPHSQGSSSPIPSDTEVNSSKSGREKSKSTTKKSKNGGDTEKLTGKDLQAPEGASATRKSKKVKRKHKKKDKRKKNRSSPSSSSSSSEDSSPAKDYLRAPYHDAMDPHPGTLRSSMKNLMDRSAPEYVQPPRGVSFSDGPSRHDPNQYGENHHNRGPIHHGDLSNHFSHSMHLPARDPFYGNRDWYTTQRQDNYHNQHRDFRPDGNYQDRYFLPRQDNYHNQYRDGGYYQHGGNAFKYPDPMDDPRHKHGPGRESHRDFVPTPSCSCGNPACDYNRRPPHQAGSEFDRRSSHQAGTEFDRHPPHQAGSELYSPNIRFCGASVPPLRHADTNTDNGTKRKILSGKHSNLSQEVRRQEAWPHTYLDKALTGEPPEYSDMSFPQFFAGMTGKILGEIDRSCVGTATENKLKHLNRVASYACNGSRDTMLAFNSCVFEAVEQNQISWSNWDGIKSLHTKHLDSIRLKVNPNDKPTIADKNERTKDSTYVPDNYMKAQNICIKFQSSVCEHEASHEIDSGATVLHICGLCHMAEKKNMSDHGFKVCPLKKKRVF